MQVAQLLDIHIKSKSEIETSELSTKCTSLKPRMVSYSNWTNVRSKANSNVLIFASKDGVKGLEA